MIYREKIPSVLTGDLIKRNVLLFLPYIDISVELKKIDYI